MRGFDSTLRRAGRVVVAMACCLGFVVAWGTGARADDRPLVPSAVYRAAADSVVLVLGINQERTTAATGAGTIIRPDGLVLTNLHVVMDSKNGQTWPYLTVFLKPAEITGDPERDLTRGVPVEVLAANPTLDIALLRMPRHPEGLAWTPLGDSEHVAVGEGVAAIGHPGGGGMWTLTTGTVSNRRRIGDRDVFQTDTALNPGNSGGPLLDRNAHVIGVNSFIARMNDQGVALEGLNYALRSSMVVAWMKTAGIEVAVARGDAVAEPAPETAQVQPASPAKSEAAATAREPEPEPGPAPAPGQPSRQAAAKPEAPVAKSDSVAAPAPAPSTASDPKPAPAPATAVVPEPTPAAPARVAKPAASDAQGARQPRAFKGPRGERYYGVPDPKMDPRQVAEHLRRRIVQNAEDAFENLERRMQPKRE